MTHQRATVRCDCGGVVDVTPTEKPWDFDWRCRSCPRRGNISWDHRQPPPSYEAKMDLFSEKNDDDLSRVSSAAPPVDLKARIEELRDAWMVHPGWEMNQQYAAEMLAALLGGAAPQAETTREALIARCSSFLGNGGLFNPELMEQQKATQLILDCRDFLQDRVGAVPAQRWDK